MLTNIKMKESDDPTKLFEQISIVENTYNDATRKIDNDDIIVVVLDAAPVEYQSLLTSEQQQQGDLLIIKDLETNIDQHHRKSKNGKKDNDEDNKLMLSDFSGTCLKCKREDIKFCNSQRKIRTRKIMMMATIRRIIIAEEVVGTCLEKNVMLAESRDIPLKIAGTRMVSVQQ